MPSPDSADISTQRSRKARFWVIVVVVVGAAVLLYALQPSVGSARRLLPALRQIRILWVLAGIACQALMYGAVAGIVRAGLRAALPSPPGPLSRVSMLHMHDAAREGESGTDGPTTLAKPGSVPADASIASHVFPPSPDSPSLIPMREGGGGWEIPGGIGMVGVSAAFLWTNRAFPGPAVAGLATLVFLLGRRGISAPTAQAAAATFYLVDYIGFVSISVVLLAVLALTGHLGSLHPVVLSIAMICIIASMTATIILLRSPRLVGDLAENVAGRGARWLRRPDPPGVARWARETVDGFYLRWRSISAHPTALASACAWAVFMHLMEIATVWCSVLAFAPAESLGKAGAFGVAAAAGFVAGNLAAIVSFLPAGIGFFEGAMGLSLHVLGGLTVEQAALATILFRLLSVWLPVPFVLRTARYAVLTVARSLRGTSNSATGETS